MVNVCLVRHNTTLIVALRDICEHRGVLWLCSCELVMDQVPERFSLRFISSGHFPLGELTPGALADDAAHLLQS